VTYVRDHLDEHRQTAHKRACGICGVSGTRDEIQTGFYNPSPKSWMGYNRISGEMSDLRDTVRTYVYNQS